MGRKAIGGRGLPSSLPAGERLLWQGRPEAGALAVHAFRIRAVGLYFAAILLLSAVVAHQQGAGAHAVGVALLHRAGLAAVPLALIAAYAWAVSATTIYSITSRRVVIRCGIALPITFNLPFARIDAAGLRLYQGGTGDITLSLGAGDGLSYFVLWPHARPWRLARSEPMLRCVPGAQAASVVLSDALAEHARAATLPEAVPARAPGTVQPAAVMQGSPVRLDVAVAG